MKITEKDLIGQIKDFPIEVVEKMIERQVEQGNPADVRVFQDIVTGGFFWNETIEGYDFWCEVILRKNFDLFFEKYPKEEEDYWIEPKGRRMLVRNGHEDWINERIVLVKLSSKVNGCHYIAVVDGDENKFKNGEEYKVTSWMYAKPIPETIELTLDQIAEKFNTTVDKIKIKK